jgi:hypothetical protein
MPIVTLYNGPSGKYEIDTDRHKVKKPERAEEKFAAKIYLKGAIWIISGLICLGLWIFLVIPAVKPLFYGHKIALDIGNERVNGYITVLLVFLGLAFPVYSLSSMVMLFKALDRAKIGPLRKTAEETIKTFIEAVQFGFWEIAYNCLTDTAQQTEVKIFSKDPYIKKKLSKIPFIRSLKDFKNHWENVSTDIIWFEDKIEIKEIDEKTIFFLVPIQYKTVEYASIIEQPRHEIVFQKKTKCPFTAIRKWKYWYLCNGFLILDN